MTVTRRVTVIDLPLATLVQFCVGMSGHSDWYANGHGGSQGTYSPDPAVSASGGMQGHDAVYEAHRLFAAYPSASATPSAHGSVVCLSVLSALTSDEQ